MAPELKQRSSPGSGLEVLLREGSGADGGWFMLLHGWSGDERSMWSLEPVLPEGALAVSVRAPYPLASGGFQWTSQGPVRDHTLEAFRPAAARLARLVDEIVAEYGLSPETLVPVGFSQGAAAAFALSIGLSARPRAMVILAGFLPGGTWPDLSGLRLYWGHGVQDEFVPLGRAREAVERLRGHGAEVTFCQADVGHKLGLECTRGLRSWLEGVATLQGESPGR